jgi:hypothetical protein
MSTYTSRDYTLQITITHTNQCSQQHCSVTAFNCGSFSTSGFPNCHWPSTANFQLQLSILDWPRAVLRSPYIYTLDTDRVENTAFNISPIVACSFCYRSNQLWRDVPPVAYQWMCLQCRSVATAVSSGFTILVFSRYAKIFFLCSCSVRDLEVQWLADQNILCWFCFQNKWQTVFMMTPPRKLWGSPISFVYVTELHTLLLILYRSFRDFTLKHKKHSRLYNSMPRIPLWVTKYIRKTVYTPLINLSSWEFMWSLWWVCSIITTWETLDSNRGFAKWITFHSQIVLEAYRVPLVNLYLIITLLYNVYWV